MSICTKFAVVFLCAAICALSLTLLPRDQGTARPSNQSTPVKLRDAKRANWLLV